MPFFSDGDRAGGKKPLLETDLPASWLFCTARKQMWSFLSLNYSLSEVNETVIKSFVTLMYILDNCFGGQHNMVSVWLNKSPHHTQDLASNCKQLSYCQAELLDVLSLDIHFGFSLIPLMKGKQKQAIYISHFDNKMEFFQ